MKIGLTGTISCGKTTLVNELKNHSEFEGFFISTERSKYLRDLGIPLNTDSTLKGQIIFAAERASELMHDDLITDRTIIDVMAFTRLSSTIDSFQKHKFEELASEIISEYDVIFYVNPEGVEIEDNGVRETNPLYRDKINSTILDIISEYSPKNIHFIHGSLEERVKQIKDYLKV